MASVSDVLKQLNAKGTAHDLANLKKFGITASKPIGVSMKNIQAVAWSRVPKWAKQKGEFQKRAGFALLACLAGHDKAATDDQFIEGLRLIEQGAADDRDLVAKGVSWALRRIGTRNKKLHAASLAVARRLAASDDASARWVGKDAVRDLTRPR